MPGWKRFEGADEWLRKRDVMAQGERDQFNQFLAGRREKAASLPSEERDRLFQEFLAWTGARAPLSEKQSSRGLSNEMPSNDGREVVVMSAPVRSGEETPSTFPTMYAPPWARGVADGAGAADAGDAGLAAVDKALNASEEFRRTLPPAASLEDGKRWRDKPFEGDLAVKRLRERPTLDPVAMPMPPAQERGGSAAFLARVAGAVGLAALAAFVVVGAMPQSRLLATVAQDPQPPSPKPDAIVPQPAATERVFISTEPAALAERFAGVPVKAETEPAIMPRAIAEPPAPAPALRPLEREEIAMLVKRSEDLVGQGDIASARLMLTRAAEAGDARAALALGATYDANVLRKLGVIGVAADAARARAWYEKAAEYGSGEATRRLEQFAQSTR